MAFQFTLRTDTEVAERAFEVPALPFGTSYALVELVKKYTEAVQDGDDGDEDNPFAAINKFKPHGLPDVATKIMFALHYDAPGWDGERLLIIEDEHNAGRIAAVQAALADIYHLMPCDWASARAQYEAAVIAEQDCYRRIWMPAWEAKEATGLPLPDGVDEEMERLQDVRCAAERILLEMPAPDLASFASKYLICFDDDRDLNCWQDHLCAEAKRLLTEPHNATA